MIRTCAWPLDFNWILFLGQVPEVCNRGRNHNPADRRHDQADAREGRGEVLPAGAGQRRALDTNRARHQYSILLPLIPKCRSCLNYYRDLPVLHSVSQNMNTVHITSYSVHWTYMRLPAIWLYVQDLFIHPVLCALHYTSHSSVQQYCNRNYIIHQCDVLHYLIYSLSLTNNTLKKPGYQLFFSIITTLIK